MHLWRDSLEFSNLCKLGCSILLSWMLKPNAICFWWWLLLFQHCPGSTVMRSPQLQTGLLLDDFRCYFCSLCANKICEWSTCSPLKVENACSIVENEGGFTKNARVIEIIKEYNAVDNSLALWNILKHFLTPVCTQRDRICENILLSIYIWVYLWKLSYQ